MKKLFYLLFAFAIILACEKDMEENYDISNINPVEAEVEVSSSDIDIDGLVDRLVSSTRKNSRKSSLNTAKDAVRGTSFITIYTGLSNGFLYEIAFDDTIAPCDNDSGLTLVTLTLDSSGGTDIRFGDRNAASIVNIPGIEFLFTLDINQGIRIAAADLAIEQATIANGVFSFNGGPSYNFVCDEWSTSSSNGIGMYTNPARPNDNFEIISAPFPLTGFLARHINLNNGDVNYAGTDLDGANGVITAIEANIKR